jgi:hypothetical protein
MSNLTAKLVRAYFRHGVKKGPMALYAGGEPVAGQWYKLYLDGCVCATGLPSPMYFRAGTGSGLIVYFFGGGLVWDGESARGFITAENLFSSAPQLANGEVDPINEYLNFAARKDNGLFSSAPDNPFADWSVAAINYGTGDFHVGRAEVGFTDRKDARQTRMLRGYDNFRLCMAEIKRLFPDTERLLIAGESAGGFGAAALAGDVIDCYPDCRNITVCSDGSLLLREDWPRVVGEFWNAPGHIAAPVQTADVTADWYRALHERYGGRIKCLFSCGAKDSELIKFQSAMAGGKKEETAKGSENFQIAMMDHIKMLKAIRPDFGVYLHDFPVKSRYGCSQHCTLLAPTFHTGIVEGMSPRQWLWNAVNGSTSDAGLHLLREGK